MSIATPRARPNTLSAERRHFFVTDAGRDVAADQRRREGDADAAVGPESAIGGTGKVSVPAAAFAGTLVRVRPLSPSLSAAIVTQLVTPVLRCYRGRRWLEGGAPA
jgi:hypothetical protein